jgi:hypothetical protein
LDDSLASWIDVEELCRWDGILLGNGASMTVWPDFGYRSLFRQARKPLLNHPLNEHAVALFKNLGTRNFEGVLSALKTAGTVCEALGLDSVPMRSTYGEVQLALYEAVASVHVPWSRIDGDALMDIREALRTYKWVFTSNYDLITYWAAMCENGGVGLPDHFFGADHLFDIRNTRVFNSRHTRLLYLHGGIHLQRLQSGRTKKRRASGVDLLTSFSTRYGDDATPLLVSEGTSADKLRSIAGSDYLTFVLERFATFSGSLVVFGHSLADQDAHLVDAIRNRPAGRIAVSVRSSGDVRAAKTRYYGALGGDPLIFFDASTHPLGSPDLRAI